MSATPAADDGASINSPSNPDTLGGLPPYPPSYLLVLSGASLAAVLAEALAEPQLLARFLAAIADRALQPLACYQPPDEAHAGHLLLAVSILRATGDAARHCLMRERADALREHAGHLPGVEDLGEAATLIELAADVLQGRGTRPEVWE